MLSRFHLIPERNRRQTGRQTDGRTDLLYQYRRALTRDNKTNEIVYKDGLYPVSHKLVQTSGD